MAGMLARLMGSLNPFFVAGATNVVTVWGGTNDIHGGSTPASVYANLKSYCSEVRSNGWKVIVATMLSRNGDDVNKNTYNNLILGDPTVYDAVADFTGTPLGIDGGYANTLYFQSDGVHPTEYSVMNIEALVISKALFTLIG